MNKKKFIPCVCLFLLLFCCFGFDFSEQKTEVALPVLMYHSVGGSGKSEYIVTSLQFEEDLKRLKEEGYRSVSVKELVAFADGKGDLPEKPVLITFDDGHYNILSEALPLLEKYGFCGVACVIGRFTEYASRHPEESGHAEYSYLTWDEIALLSRSGRMEIGNHTYDMHNFSPRFGVGRKKGENDLLYVENFEKDITKLDDRLATYCDKPIVFAYPFGRYNHLAQESLLKKGYRMTLTCNEGINTVRKGDKNTLIHLKRFNRSSSYSSEKVITLLR